MSQPVDLAALRAVLEKMTPGPWAWESIAEKSNEFAVGQAWNLELQQPIAGRVPSGEIEDTIIERREVVGTNESGHARFADAAGICALRNAADALLTELEQLRDIKEQSNHFVAELRFVRDELRMLHSDAPTAHEALEDRIRYFQRCEAELEQLRRERDDMQRAVTQSTRAVRSAEKRAIEAESALEQWRAQVAEVQAIVNESGTHAGRLGRIRQLLEQPHVARI